MRRGATWLGDGMILRGRRARRARGWQRRGHLPQLRRTGRDAPRGSLHLYGIL